jgi:hypothetical protein
MLQVTLKRQKQLEIHGAGGRENGFAARGKKEHRMQDSFKALYKINK